MAKEIRQAGFSIIDSCLRKKTEYVKFGRYIYVCVQKYYSKSDF